MSIENRLRGYTRLIGDSPFEGGLAYFSGLEPGSGFLNFVVICTKYPSIASVRLDVFITAGSMTVQRTQLPLDESGLTTMALRNFSQKGDCRSAEHISAG